VSSDGSLPGGNEIENIIAAMENPGEKGELPDQSGTVSPHHETVFAEPFPAIPSPAGPDQTDSLDTWSDARSKSIKIIIGAILVIMTAVSVALYFFLT
jgi:hypothetical protein